MSPNQRKYTAVFVLAFCSGLPLLLTGGTLQAWLTQAGLDLKVIGWSSLLGLPYLWKFLWAPLLDRIIPPFWGRRRGWILICQIALFLSILACSFFNPYLSNDLQWLFVAAFAIATFSATADIAIDAHRTEILGETERPRGNSLYTLGYRLALITAGSIALILADHIGFARTYQILALIQLLTVVGTLLSPEPAMPKQPLTGASWLQTFALPLQDILQRRRIWIMLLFIPLYKFGDAFAFSLSTAFFIRALHFSLSEIGWITKIVGVTATIVGISFGGYLIERLGLFKALLFGGFLQALATLGFLTLNAVGHNIPVFIIITMIDNVCSGVGTAAFVVTLMQWCNPQFTASQYALFSAFAAIGRVLIGPFAGHFVESYGWNLFFCLSLALCVPGIILLLPIRPLLITQQYPKAS